MGSYTKKNNKCIEFSTEYKYLGLSLSYFRKLRRLTQQQLADRMNINYETISRIENGYTGISSDMLFSLSKALEVPLSELFEHAKL